MIGWSVSVLGNLPINNLLRPCNQSKNGQNRPNGISILLRRNGYLISVRLWNRLSTFIVKHLLQNLKSPLIANRTICGRTLGCPVDLWVAFGDRATIFQQHWSLTAWSHHPPLWLTMGDGPPLLVYRIKICHRGQLTGHLARAQMRVKKPQWIRDKILLLTHWPLGDWNEIYDLKVTFKLILVIDGWGM